MADERLLPPGIDDDRGRALLQLIERLGALDLTVLLIYRIDSVLAAALPLLAWQFHVLGFEGWDLAHTEQEQRDLIARAVELHRHKGTPWAIRTALASVGYGDLTIDEGGASWAEFTVRTQLTAEGVGLTPAERTLIAGIIERYKPARSRLASVAYGTPPVVDDAPLPDDPPMSMTVHGLFFFDGAHAYDGTFTYRGSSGTPMEVA